MKKNQKLFAIFLASAALFTAGCEPKYPDSGMCFQDFDDLSVECYNLKNDMNSKFRLKADAVPTYYKYPDINCMIKGCEVVDVNGCDLVKFKGCKVENTKGKKYKLFGVNGFTIISPLGTGRIINYLRDILD